MAEGLIRSGQAKKILFLTPTAETYSKYIDREDRSLRTIFGDAAAATLITAEDVPAWMAFNSGPTDSVQTRSWSRMAECVQPVMPFVASSSTMEKSTLYGWPSLDSFTVEAVPKLIDQVLGKSQKKISNMHFLLFHQATAKMLLQLQETLGSTATSCRFGFETSAIQSPAHFRS